MMRCRICGGSRLRAFSAREMMFGTRQEFVYHECFRCGCLQLAEPPADMARYYPDGYYSFSSPVKGAMERWMRSRRSKFCISGKGLVGRALASVYGRPDFVRWTKTAGAGLSDRILDVGCGGGELLYNMMLAGYTNLTGADPYIDESTTVAGRITLLKRRIQQIEGEFDLIMLNHSFEHMETPFEVFDHLSRLLAPQGCLLIRIPVADSYAWRTYGPDWVQLDAPRHLFLHTRESIGLLAESAGFEITNIAHDSTAFQFWGSEQYRRDIPLRAPDSLRENPRSSPFSEEDVKVFEQRAQDLNRTGDGDQACFYLHFRTPHAKERSLHREVAKTRRTPEGLRDLHAKPASERGTPAKPAAEPPRRRD